MNRNKFANIDFEILFHTNDVTPAGQLAEIVCPFCDYLQKLRIPSYQPEGSPNLAREAMEAHWMTCPEFPNDGNA